MAKDRLAYSVYILCKCYLISWIGFAVLCMMGSGFVYVSGENVWIDETLQLMWVMWILYAIPFLFILPLYVISRRNKLPYSVYIFCKYYVLAWVSVFALCMACYCFVFLQGERATKFLEVMSGLYAIPLLFILPLYVISRRICRHKIAEKKHVWKNFLKHALSRGRLKLCVYLCCKYYVIIMSFMFLMGDALVWTFYVSDYNLKSYCIAVPVTGYYHFLVNQHNACLIDWWYFIRVPFFLSALVYSIVIGPFFLVYIILKKYYGKNHGEEQMPLMDAQQHKQL